ncbi:unnamed protein product [Durusdinium trenchii]|uniref:RING-type domain-containing protein n=1 Tax=Durusdinium trenchii TaxID=1381693 RepID=A0ABP0MUC8_9DINO
MPSGAEPPYATEESAREAQEEIQPGSLPHAEAPENNEEEDLTEDEAEDRAFRGAFVSSETVLDLSCQHCTQLLCQRGMRVRLVCNAAVSLFSTDFRPMVKEAVEEREHGMCHCRVRDVQCGCGCTVGYHVILPCTECSSACHNDQYWLFDRNVKAANRTTPEGAALVWSELPKHEAVENDRSSQAPDDETVAEGEDLKEQDAPSCPICHERMRRPLAPPCGHAACESCLTRAVDLRRECPYCRMTTTCAQLTRCGTRPTVTRAEVHRREGLGRRGVTLCVPLFCYGSRVFFGQKWGDAFGRIS